MTRPLSLLALVALVASAAVAQPVYNGLDARPDYGDGPGVRLGLGVGAFVYDGPSTLSGPAALQRDVTETGLGLTGELTFPLANQLYGRLLGGVVNLGASDDGSGNPYRTGPSALAEADLLFYLTPPRTGTVAPYLFSGISALFATGDGAPSIETTALAIPVGLGIEYGVSDNLALFAEGSYRFGLNDVGRATGGGAAAMSDDVCDASGPNYNPDACKKKGGTPFCSNGGQLPDCTEVDNGGRSRFDGRFNSGLLLGGLRLGFGGGGGGPVIPPPPVLPPVTPAPPPVTPPSPPIPAVCDLVELNAITFGYGSGTLDRRARARLDENVELLLSNPACCVFIDGYTDTAESGQYGFGLSGRRAQTVYDYYLSQGVSASRLQIRNRGTASPDCDKEDPGPGCELNRRVESIPVDCERFRFLIENPSYDPY